jgi:hypothetical protein
MFRIVHMREARFQEERAEGGGCLCLEYERAGIISGVIGPRLAALAAGYPLFSLVDSPGVDLHLEMERRALRTWGGLVYAWITGTCDVLCTLVRYRTLYAHEHPPPESPRAFQ